VAHLRHAVDNAPGLFFGDVLLVFLEPSQLLPLSLRLAVILPDLLKEILK
jgi:hypothetical protein